ncbi:hypothetical protein Cha6605_5950 [Chamaesiphon minutus PCC 6605]|uniref:Uncharacterized protein n=1 Tax=Chamaesiphon minutus (strain ATCC 27169 / PCC 6605) TaxID=1173020 RepID=K9UQT5_CHAP6|nr:hypothetical protein Cha6605_5950 [Chamaesiphon minutus PCC 6605]
MMSRFKFLILSSVFLCLCDPALAEGSEQGGNQQSPLQVIVSIVITAIVLRVLRTFKLP